MEIKQLRPGFLIIIIIVNVFDYELAAVNCYLIFAECSLIVRDSQGRYI